MLNVKKTFLLLSTEQKHLLVNTDIWWWAVVLQPLWDVVQVCPHLMNNARQDGWIKGSERRKIDMRKKDRKTEEEEDRGGRWRASSTTRSSPPGGFTLGGETLHYPTVFILLL